MEKQEPKLQLLMTKVRLEREVMIKPCVIHEQIIKQGKAASSTLN